jgi:hypothetical protein
VADARADAAHALHRCTEVGQPIVGNASTSSLVPANLSGPTELLGSITIIASAGTGALNCAAAITTLGANVSDDGDSVARCDVGAIEIPEPAFAVEILMSLLHLKVLMRFRNFSSR